MNHRLALSFALAAVLASQRADAGGGFGADIGLVKRYDEPNSNPSLGYGLLLHGDLSVIPTVRLGAYYFLAYEPSHDVVRITTHTLGARATFLVPVSGDFQPYFYGGAGYSWASYTYSGFIECASNVQCGPPEGSGHYLELPLGAGVAYSASSVVQLKLDAAYRPGVGFAGKVFEEGGAHPTHGWSLMFGVGYLQL